MASSMWVVFLFLVVRPKHPLRRCRTISHAPAAHDQHGVNALGGKFRFIVCAATESQAHTSIEAPRVAQLD